MQGVGYLTAAEKAVRKARFDGGRAKAAVRRRPAGLVTQLRLLDADRARRARQELEGPAPDLAALRKLLVTTEAADESVGAAMRQLIELEPIDVDAVARAADGLGKAIAAQNALTGTPAAEARQPAPLPGAAPG